MDASLLEILCCPVSRVPLQLLSRKQLECLNAAIAGDGLQTVEGDPVAAALTAGLITRDCKVIYPIEDGIPVLLPESGIGIQQLQDFPR